MKLPDVSRIEWPDACRLVRCAPSSTVPFDDIAGPEDWARLSAGERSTDPQVSEAVGNLDLLPLRRRIEGPDADVLMAPFTHVSPDRQSRFSTGRYGVLYAGNSFETALLETIEHHERFLRSTAQAAGWTSTFQEVVFAVRADLHDMRGSDFRSWLDAENYAAAHAIAEPLAAAGSDGIVYPSVRWPGGECVALFYPDVAADVRPGRIIDLHWNGSRVDYLRDHAEGGVLKIERP